MIRLFLIFSVLLVTACGERAAKDQKVPLTLKESSFQALPGWSEDQLDGFVHAYAKSCDLINKRPADRAFGPLKEAGTYADWQAVCTKFASLDNPSEVVLRAFFEEFFTPYQVRAGNKAEGLFTGYYEASLRGSRERFGPFQTPLHARPDDLVMVQLGDFREELKGQRIAGRVVGGNLKPYESRPEIVAGQWPHNDQVLLWVDDPVDAFYVQIQGSGVVRFVDGSETRIGYAGQNGHPYYAIGRELIKREHLTKDDVSMQAIREWLTANPEEGEDIMNTNKSYVFFRELDTDGPIGGMGVTLTPGRSLAIDRSLISYGLPIWVDIDYAAYGKDRIQRLMVTQDTGGAIRGPVRGDFFWGYGPEAERLAGPMAEKGRYWILLPKKHGHS